MAKYFAVPYLNQNVVKISDATGVVASSLALGHPGANAVVHFADPKTGERLLFVSYDEHNTAGSATSHIDIFNVTNPVNPALQSSVSLTNAPCGMAIQPGTLDLYVATFSDDITDGSGSTLNPGGVFSFTHASGYAQASRAPFVTFNDSWAAVASVCANLAFDTHGNLWMTTYQSGSSSPDDHFLICFIQVDRNAGSSQRFFKLANRASSGAAAGAIAVSDLPLAISKSAVSGPLFPFSEPHGIAFDPLGNLWMANNSDDSNVNGLNPSGAVNGTLLRVDRTWIDNYLLTDTAKLALLDPVHGYGVKTVAGVAQLLTLPTAAGVGATLFGFADARLGGLSCDGFDLYASDQSGNDAFHQKIWKVDTRAITMTTPGSAVPVSATGIATTYPGNATMAIFNATPARLLIRNSKADTGVEPDTHYFLWESPDIALSETVIAGLPAFNTTATSAIDLYAAGSAHGGTNPASVYVRVANKGGAGDPSTTGSEVLKLYWAKASAGLDWPAPWDGLAFQDPATRALSYGGLIGAQPLGLIDPGKESVYHFDWNVPDTSQYATDDGHFCLYARVESASLVPFGMDYPEQVGLFSTEQEASLGANAANNAAIGWRNVAVLDPVMMKRGMGSIPLGFLAANWGARESTMRFAVQTLDQRGRIHRMPAKMHVVAGEIVHERLIRENPGAHLGERRYALGGLSLCMVSRETLPLHFTFEPEDPKANDYAVRLVQLADSRRGTHVVGGQTFVVGKVRGLNA